MFASLVHDPTSKQRSRALFAVVALVTLFTAPLAQAQAVGSGGTIGLYFDEALTQTTIENPPAFTPVTAYLAVSDILGTFPDAELNAYEVQIVIPEGWLLLGTTLIPETSLNVGSQQDNVLNLIVGTGQNIDIALEGDQYVVATLNLFPQIADTPPGTRIELNGTAPSSADPPEPLWNDVGSGSDRIYTFDTVVEPVINPVPCGVVDATFDGTVVTAVDGGGGNPWTFDAGKTVSGTLLTDIDEGDGAINVLYWTEASASENGQIGVLDCLGNELWAFVDSGSACDPAEAAANYVDVVDFQIGDFTDANAGDEVLLISTAPGLTRLTLHALDGSLVSGNAEIWADYDFGTLLIEGDALYFGGLKSTGEAAVLRDTFAAFRGGTIDVGACTVGGLAERVFSGDTTNVTGLSVAEDLLTVTTGADSYEVDAVTLEDVFPLCELFSVAVDGGTVIGLDSGGNELWRYEVGVEVVNAFRYTQEFSEPVKVVVSDGRLVYLDCFGELVLEFFPFSNCYGDEGEQLVTGPVTTANEIVWYFVTDVATGKTTLASLVRSTGPVPLAQGDSYDLPGPPSAFLLDQDGGGNQILYLAFANGLAGGSAHVVAIDPDDVGGAAPPVQEGCTEGTQLWSSLFDGTGGFPAIAAAPSEIVAGPGVLQISVTIDGEVYQLDKGTGELIVTCDLADVSADGDVVTALDGGGNALFTYEAPGEVVLVDVFDGLGGFELPVVVGLADASETTQATAFLLDCDGAVVFETPLVGDDNCFGVAQPQAAVNRDVTGIGAFTAEGATELWAVVSGSAGEGEPTLTYVVTVDLDAWTVVGSYLHFGPVEAILPLDGLPLQVAMGGANESTGAAAAFLIEAGANGESFPGCEAPPARVATGELWYVNFDGTDAPLVEEPFSAITADGELLEYATAGGESFLIRRASGDVLTDVELSVAPLTGEAKPGENYTITLELDNAAALAAVEGVLTYDAATLDVVSTMAELAGFSSAINAEVDGEVRFALASDTGLGAAAGTLLTVEFVVADDALVGDVAFDLADVLAFDETPAAIGIVTAGAALSIGCETGDVNGDGAIRSDDAVLALRIGVGLVTPTAQQECAADVNEDGTVDSGDAVAILRQVVGLPTGTGVARAVALDVRGDGDAVALDGDRYAVELRVRGGGDVAGVDLTLGAPRGFTIETVSLVDANAAAAFRRDRDAAHFAAADARALHTSGDARVRVVLGGKTLEAGDVIDLRVLEATAYGTDGVRAALDETATVTFGAPASEIVSPARTELLQNVPNPFNPRTEILFRLADRETVRVHVFDVAGRRVATLRVGTKDAGEHSVVWQGTDDLGRPVSSGVYMYQLETTAGVVSSKRMTLVR